MPPIVDSVRPARAEDVPEVLRLWAIARSPAATSRDDARTVEHLLAHDAGALLIAVREGSIVGTVIAGWDGWRGQMYRLAVMPEHRLQGIGRHLVASAHERLRGLGATRVSAVGQHEPGPTGFWTALGYEHDPGMARFAKDL